MTEDVPASLRPPVSLALAKADDSVPAEGAMPGGSMYEPKFDGHEAAIFVRPGEPPSSLGKARICPAILLA